MNKKQFISILVAIIVSASGGYWIAKQGNNNVGTTIAIEGESEPKPLFYRNAMNPSVTSPVPAKDGMGMDYVPVYADDSNASGPSGTVKIDPVTTQNIGVKTTRVKKITFSSDVQALGRVTYNEETIVRIHPKTEGWIEELIVNKTGALIKKDDRLLGIYSPQLVTGQQEYILAIKSLNELKPLKNSRFDQLYINAVELAASSRQRLELLDVPEHQIKELEQNLKIKKSLHIHAPTDGVVINIDARQGQYVTPKTELFMMADLSRVWVLAEVYENELQGIKVGTQAHLRLAGLPGRVFRGKLVYIYPYAQSKTRTIQVRMEFDNKDLALKPEMFANITIHAGKTENALVIPTQAIVRTGTREQVFVVRAPGKFEPREVTLGITNEGNTQILKGLKLGEEVVTSSLFLIDSESKLREATFKMMEQEKPASMAPEMKMKSDSTIKNNRTSQKHNVNTVRN